MPVVDGEKAARMIKSTVNPSANAPIVAVCSHAAAIDAAAGTLFAATLSKPIVRSLLHYSPSFVH
jgi:serine/threonine-protein kinase RIM15